jgi:hypothetical protein
MIRVVLSEAKDLLFPLFVNAWAFADTNPDNGGQLP